MREARAHLELQGELTGELNGADATDRQVVIVVPAQVPIGANVPLRMKVSEEAVHRALPERDGTVDVQAEDLAKPTMRLLGPGTVEQAEVSEKLARPARSAEPQGKIIRTVIARSQ